MTASQRIWATVLLTSAVILYVVGHVLPVILSPGTPPSVISISKVLSLTAIPLFAIGSCIYSRSKGYPLWLGICSFTVVGFLILLLLPDHYSEPGDED